MCIRDRFIPAQWPHPRLKHWEILAMARAIENQMFVAAVNGVGTANDLKFCGNSMLIEMCIRDRVSDSTKWKLYIAKKHRGESTCFYKR